MSEPAAASSKNPIRGLAVALVATAALLLAFAASAQAPVTSDAQAQWLKQRGVLRAAPERDYGPFVFVDNAGRVTGLSVEMLELVQQRTGVVLDWLPARPLSEQLDLARRREADLLTSLRPSAERSGYLLFSRAYVKVPTILVVRAGEEAPTLNELRERPVAIGAGYAAEPVMRASYPNVSWSAVGNDVEAMRGVAERRFDAAVVDAASAAFVMRHHGLPGLASGGEVGFDYELSFAVRSDWPELRQILDAGIAAIPSAERQAVLERWIGPLQAGQMAERAPIATRVGILLVLFAVLAGAALYAQRVRVKRVEPRPRGRRPPGA